MKLRCGKKLLIRLVAIVVVILVGVMMYFIGREHTVLLDNKTVTLASGTEAKALKLVTVQVDRTEALELAARDRDKSVVTNQSHKITVSYTDANWNEVTITKKFKIPVGEDMVIISIPTLVANQDAGQDIWLTKYVAPKVEIKNPQDEKGVITDEFSFSI
ncbi:MAG: DUF6672 family protein [Sphaerochaetaceae bacterium]